MSFDDHANFAYSTVTVPPPIGGNTLEVDDASNFPDPPFNATVWAANHIPTSSNATIIRVTTVSSDRFTFSRSQENSNDREILMYDQITAGITKKTLTDIETGSTVPFVTVGSSNADYIVDGVADNVEIQAAVDAVNSAGGGIVFIKKGTYVLAAQVNIANVSYVKIQGAGAGVTILQNYGIRKNDNTATYNMVFEDFTIDCQSNLNVQAMSFVNNSYFFRMKRVELKNCNGKFLLQWGLCDRLIVEDCYFYDGGLVTGADNCAGSQLTTTNNTSIFRNCWFVKEFSAGGGLITTGQTGNLLIDGCSFVDLSNNSYAAVSIEHQTGSSKNVQIVNCKTYRVGFIFGVNTNSNRLARGSIVNCMIEGVAGANAAGGITTQRVDDLLVMGNTISDTTYGIFIKDNGYVKVAHNKIKNTDSASGGFPSDKAGLYISGNTIVEANQNIVWDTGGTTPYGVRIVGGSQKVYLDNNKLLGPFVTNSIQTTSTLAFLAANNNDYSGGSQSFGTITASYSTNNIGKEL